MRLFLMYFQSSTIIIKDGITAIICRAYICYCFYSIFLYLLYFYLSFTFILVHIILQQLGYWQHIIVLFCIHFTLYIIIITSVKNYKPLTLIYYYIISFHQFTTGIFQPIICQDVIILISVFLTFILFIYIHWYSTFN